MVFEQEKFKVHQSVCQNFVRSGTSHNKRAFSKNILLSMIEIIILDILFTLFFVHFAILTNFGIIVSKLSMRIELSKDSCQRSVPLTNDVFPLVMRKNQYNRYEV